MSLKFRSPLRGPWLTSVLGLVLLIALPIVIITGLLSYIDRLKGTAKLRPDSKMTVARDWATSDARLNGALQLSRGLARVAAAGDKKEAA